VARHINTVKNTFVLFRPYLNRESILSISATDFSFAYNSSLHLSASAQDTPSVISSEIWGEEEGASELIKIAEERIPFRVQISVGAELQKYENRLRAFLDLGGACDLLFDRPLSKDLQQKLLPLIDGSDFRLCLVVSRYFDVQTVIDSLAPDLRKHLFLLFLPPENKSSCYLSNDEVVRVLNALDANLEWNAVVMSNVVEHCASIQDRNFFATLDLEAYYAGPKLLKDYSFFRNSIGWLARRKFVFILDFIYSFIVFLKNPQNFLRYRTWASLRHGTHMGFIILWHRVLKPLPQFIRHRFWAWLRHSVHMSFIFLWYRILKPLPTYIRYRIWAPLKHRAYMCFIFIRYRAVPPAFNFIRYTVIPWLQIFILHRVPWILSIVFYPVLKIYWFTSYQFENRLLPLLKRESKDP